MSDRKREIREAEFKDRTKEVGSSSFKMSKEKNHTSCPPSTADTQSNGFRGVQSNITELVQPGMKNPTTDKRGGSELKKTAKPKQLS